MKDRYLEAKIELLESYDTSDEICESLKNEVRAYAQHTSYNSLKVTDEPYCAPWEIDVHVSLLSDLREYTELHRTGSAIPEHLQYIVAFWKNDDNLE